MMSACATGKVFPEFWQEIRCKNYTNVRGPVRIATLSGWAGEPFLWARGRDVETSRSGDSIRRRRDR